MNMKTLAVLVLMGLGLSAYADDSSQREDTSSQRNRNGQSNRNQNFTISPVCAKALIAGDEVAAKDAIEKAGTAVVDLDECKVLKALSPNISAGPVDRTSSMDGLINCQKPESYTKDYDACKAAAENYNYVINAETALGVIQQVQTTSANSKIQKSANQQIASGNAQNGMFDASIASNEHQKQMQGQQAAAYALAVGALVNAYRNIPTKADVLASCGAIKNCKTVVDNRESSILANQSARTALQTAIAAFTAKGIAAGIKMNQYDQQAQAVAAAKNYVQDTSTDAMVERCVFNPTDPACAISSTPVTGSSYTGGSFTIGDSAGNAFGSTPDTTTSETPVTDYGSGGDTVTGVNSPFEEQAKVANGIVDPAAAAQTQSTGGAANGGGGGGAGGGGGGSASLGSDLQGADKNADKEAQIKTNKVSGSYTTNGGSGFAAVKGGKDNANPFASLFDSKTAGGLEEDRSIASGGDIDGSGSGLFQKISKRYGQVQADKRIEASNLE